MAPPDDMRPVEKVFPRSFSNCTVPDTDEPQERQLWQVIITYGAHIDCDLIFALGRRRQW